MGTRFGAKLPGPQPPQEYVDDLRGSFSLQGIWVRQRFFLSTDRRMSAHWRVRFRHCPFLAALTAKTAAGASRRVSSVLAGDWDGSGDPIASQQA
jgi:hypothetical protein